MRGERILIVESSPARRDRLGEALCTAPSRYAVDVAASLSETRARLVSFQPHAAVIDLDTPSHNRGFVIIREIRGHPVLRPMGVLALSSRLLPGEEYRALLRGADLCLVGVAIANDRLYENVRALLRVVHVRRGGKICRGPLVLCPRSKRAWAGRRRLMLTLTQFDMLLRLAVEPGQPCSHASLLGCGEGPAFADVHNVARVQMCAIRRELGPHAHMVRTVRGQGYCLTID